ncbi:universal stress protein [Actinacidiphila oryziradicis]|uniref:Universal stress protein n=1 Tax=Actinacidiphila oryziradicis TaxID=2571141 RepID=A0A4U0SJX8_9ACTN|nr:universal stress protein [Actinacidiphila oryziradicis]TKA09453.1 universal stress protein [Actinacidiphila oryziradicis]
MSEFTDARPIVVGVNGSLGSLTALRWAASEAHLLRVPLVVVHAWEPTAGLLAPYAPAATRRTPAEDRDRAKRVLHTALSAVLGPLAQPAVRAVLAEGPPAAVLLRHADDALLLALGRHAPADGVPPAWARWPATAWAMPSARWSPCRSPP